jgi:tRNA/rRNA methyltransferase
LQGNGGGKARRLIIGVCVVKTAKAAGWVKVGSPSQPAVILVEPQLGENIGTAARAMANFGLSRLRLVRPRDGWPNEKAVAAASGAVDVLTAAELYDDVPAAVADLGFVFATTARSREVAKLVRGPEEAAVALTAREAAGTRTGVLFGRERWGLSNEEIAFADEILTLPVDPEHASLNIAQAVLIVAYEWRLAAIGGARPFSGANEADPATKADLLGLFEHLEAALEEAGFFRPPEKKPHMVQSLRAMFQRAGLSDQEVRTLRGVVAAFERRPTRPPRSRG